MKPVASGLFPLGLLFSQQESHGGATEKQLNICTGVSWSDAHHSESIALMIDDRISCRTGSIDTSYA
jgi:hypothetical protein